MLCCQSRINIAQDKYQTSRASSDLEVQSFNPKTMNILSVWEEKRTQFTCIQLRNNNVLQTNQFLSAKILLGSWI